MSVFHEIPRPAVEKSLDSWWKADQGLSPTALANALPTCQAGANVLTSIMLDLKAQLELHTNIDLETAEDASDLITIVSYLYFGPLFGILSTLGGKLGTGMYDQNFYDYEKAMSNLLEAVYAAQAALRIVRPALFGQQLQTMENILWSGSDQMVKITPTNPIVLLLRIVTAREKWDSLEHLCKEYRRLNIAKSRGLHPGLPKTIFVCRGTSPNDDPVYGISASADHWTHFEELNQFVWKLRNSRLNAIAKAVDGGEGDVRRIKVWSRNIPQRRKGEGKNKPTVASLVQNSRVYFSHLHDVATPLTCPSFQPKARCIRCQVLFRYEVPQNVKEKEKDVPDDIYTGFSCAEIHAHFFCRALENRRHAKCITHGI
ncbi:hypothetical protein FPANT_9816 [Fusarium pseudoanthophilum]|uniref:Uncharacterized protein n=1 Tax=Fusarium pseudoanthophilum TaxID=48495 RepID=A0A8H5NX47_9HYPO|nr:hypothetical protein FPANT_9816 [Fusarium pseudoanthophilum]